MKALIHWAENKSICRTLLIQNYFGEKTDKDCGVCDVCSKKESLHQSSILEMLKKHLLVYRKDIHSLLEFF